MTQVIQARKHKYYRSAMEVTAELLNSLHQKSPQNMLSVVSTCGISHYVMHERMIPLLAGNMVTKQEVKSKHGQHSILFSITARGIEMSYFLNETIAKLQSHNIKP